MGSWHHARVFVIDGHAIYRRGIVASLGTVSEATGVGDAGSVRAARENERLADATLVLLDHDLSGAREMIRELHSRDVAILVCTESVDEDAMLASIQAGARGFLSKATLTPEKLAAAIRAAHTGAGVMAPELLGNLLEGISRVSREVLEPNGLSLARLTAREQSVLRLIAEGYQTREVAEQLSYSERTIKNVVHDILTKLGARGRSQAVAQAMREGLI
ncbi:MAG TPA: response regulator transcription factor [Solirubrobacterales bacterium]|nr:response regulator transcription factor [Solirubrobacterales bacterium]